MIAQEAVEIERGEGVAFGRGVERIDEGTVILAGGELGLLLERLVKRQEIDGGEAFFTRGFEEASIEAVKRWRYEPATFDGAPIDSYLTVVSTFEPPKYAD